MVAGGRKSPGEVFGLLNCAVRFLSERKFARVLSATVSPPRCGLVALSEGIPNSSSVGMEKSPLGPEMVS